MQNPTSPFTCSLIIISFSFFTFHFSFTTAQTINTFAGTGTGSYNGDGIQATTADIYNPSGVYVDAFGNLFFADQSNNRIREVNTSGTITTVAGVGVGSFSGDGGQATAAEISSPQGVFIDKYGNLFFTDFFNNRVREVNTSGVIKTIAGNGFTNFSGDGGPATAAELNGPSDVVTDSAGNIYIADEAYSHIRIVNTSGIINTFAGNGTNGYSGDGGPATAAEIHGPSGVRIDAAQNIYIADLQNDVIRKVNTSGIISTIAGIGEVAGFSGDGGQATAAELSSPTGLSFDGSGNMYIADEYRIRMINTSGIITSVAGTGSSGYGGDGGPATSAEIDYAFAVASDAHGDFWLGDVFNNRVRKITVPVSTGLNNETYFNNGINLYPNPNNGQFEIELSGVNDKSSLEIYNLLGEIVLKATLNSYSNRLDLSKEASGIYIYKILSVTGQLIGSGKFIIE